MKNLTIALGFVAAAALASSALAGPGYGPGAGAGCAAGTAANCPAGMGPGSGMGPGGRMGGGGGRGDAAGFNLMTPEERTSHRDHMRSLKSAEECTTYLAAHHAEMAARAAAKGITLPEPRANACERMKARGRFG